MSSKEGFSRFPPARNWSIFATIFRQITTKSSPIGRYSRRMNSFSSFMDESDETIIGLKYDELHHDQGRRRCRVLYSSSQNRIENQDKPKKCKRKKREKTMQTNPSSNITISALFKKIKSDHLFLQGIHLAIQVKTLVCLIIKFICPSALLNHKSIEPPLHHSDKT